MSEKREKYIYIVVSKTDTALGKVIQRKLGVNYNHCSISLDESLENIYSFGRKELRNMFRAGFVMESKSNGFFKVHSGSDIAVLRIPVAETQWHNVADCVANFEEHKDIYKYNILGLIYCYLGIEVTRKDKYFCSQFVAEILELSGVSLFDKPETLVRPHDFLQLPQGMVIYRGAIGDYHLA